MVQLSKLVLTLVTFVDSSIFACAAYSPILSHHQRSQHLHLHAHVQRRQASPPQVSLIQLQQLQGYLDAYRGWVNNHLNQNTQGDPAIEQLRQEFTAFDGWIKSWLQVAMGLCTIIPAHDICPTKLTMKAAETYPSIGPGGGASPVPVAPSTVAVAPIKSQPTSTYSSPSEAVATSAGSDPAAPSDVAYVPSTNSGGSSVFNAAKGRKFNPLANNNVAVYWGQAAENRQVSLTQICKDPNIDIVNLAFLITYKGQGGYPTVNFAGNCWDMTAEQRAKGASGLLYCPEIGAAIKVCQANAKIVHLSIGGEAGSAHIDFDSQKDATDAAAMVWDLFGGGKGQPAGLRPFGSVKLDGFDLDTENKKPAFYADFTKALRSKFSTDKSKPYYISSAPQCPLPDESIPLAALLASDFVYVQFYNNPPCGLGSPDFLTNLKQWSDLLSKGVGGGKGVRLLVGAPGCPVPGCSGSGYVDAKAMRDLLVTKKGRGVKGFGGVMLWEGSRAELNGNGAFVKSVKGLLSEK